jgi:hypothetical protein
MTLTVSFRRTNVIKMSGSLTHLSNTKCLLYSRFRSFQFYIQMLITWLYDISHLNTTVTIGDIVENVNHMMKNSRTQNT